MHDQRRTATLFPSQIFGGRRRGAVEDHGVLKALPAPSILVEALPLALLAVAHAQ